MHGVMRFGAFFRRYLLWCVVLVLVEGTIPLDFVAARVYIDITSPFLRQIPIAVPYLDAESKSFEDDLLGRKMANILSDDLAFHGFFAVLDPARYGGRSDADWRQFRLDHLVKGSLRRNGDGLAMEFRLFDLASGAQMEGRRYTGHVRDHRAVAHRFCDLIVKAVTGEPGVSLSRIALVGTQGEIKEIYTADFDGFNLKRETFDKAITVSPRLSPDGLSLVYTSFRSGRPYLYLKDLESGKVRRLTAFEGLNIAPSWAPDGRRLAVTLSKDGYPNIYVIDLSGNIREQLTRVAEINVSPTWSPDGTRLAFVSDRSGSPQIYILDLTSRGVKRLTYSGAYNTDPQWSPRGDRIAYVGRVAGEFQVFTISPEGDEPVQLTTSGSNENPSWSPDGRQLVFSSTRLGAEKALFVMFANGQGQRVLINMKGLGLASPHWGPNRL